MIYLGTLGRMIGIKCPASQQVEHEERYTFQTTLEGRRKAQVRPRGPRTWSLQTSDATTPEQAATLMQFAQGAWGPGPFVFVSADAPHTNMLTPGASMCRESEQFQPDVVYGGPVLLSSGMWAAGSYMSGQPTTYLFGRGIYPLPPSGSNVTGSLHVQGANARARLNWYAADKSYLGSSAAELTPGEGWRVSSVTAKPPVGAAGVGLGALTATACAAPILVWGNSSPSWSVGEGCLEAVVHAVSRDLRLAVPGSTYSNLSFTITEVG